MPISAQNRSKTAKKATQKTVEVPTPTGPTTIYYDENWKGVQAKDFATYERTVFYSTDPHYPNRFKDVRMDGSVAGEGIFQSIDKYDDANSVFVERKTYYPNGAVESTEITENGKTLATTYYITGIKYAEGTLVNGKLHGLVKTYGPSGTVWKEENYVNGEPDPSAQFYYVKTLDGGCVKHDAKTNKKLDIEAPTAADKYTSLSEGLRWDGIKKNGLDVSACADKVEDYGGKNNMLTTGLKRMVGNKGTKQYTRLTITVINNTATSVVFDPSSFKYSDMTKPNKPKNLEFVTFADYVKSLDGSQKWQASYNAADERAMAKEVATTSRSASKTSAASSSSSYSQTNASLLGKSSSAAVAGGGFGAVGRNGVAAGGFGAASASNSSINGKYNSSSASSSGSVYNSASSSETVDAEVYRQGMKDAAENVEKFNRALDDEREQKINLYMKATTIEPFGSYTGYILTRNTDVTDISCSIELEGIEYPISLKVSDVRNR